ncbi:phage tail protein [Yersinia frederiksenii]|nr:phage tail protein [Yersinia frederiksenii]
METFNWKVDPDMEVETEPRVTVIKLGDGYEQRRANGINSNLEKYNVTVRVKHYEASYLSDFLNRHGGVKAFLWIPPYNLRPIKVVCRKWSAKVGLLKVIYTATFEEVVA